jgi:hypothetical protein
MPSVAKPKENNAIRFMFAALSGNLSSNNRRVTTDLQPPVDLQPPAQPV